MLGLFSYYSVPRKVSMLQVSQIPISCSLAGEASSPSLVFLSSLRPQLQNLAQARILCHLSCVLTVCLRWICSLCSCIFKEVFKLPQIQLVRGLADFLLSRILCYHVEEMRVPISIANPLFQYLRRTCILERDQSDN